MWNKFIIYHLSYGLFCSQPIILKTHLSSLQLAMATGYTERALSELLLTKLMGTIPTATWFLPKYRVEIKWTTEEQANKWQIPNEYSLLWFFNIQSDQLLTTTTTVNENLNLKFSQNWFNNDIVQLKVYLKKFKYFFYSKNEGIYILPPNGRPSSLMLNSIVSDSVSEECSRCSLIAHTRTDARSTPQAWKSVSIFWMDRVLRTTLKTIFFTAFISFLLKSTAVSLERCKQIQIFKIEGKLVLWSTIIWLLAT